MGMKIIFVAFLCGLAAHGSVTLTGSGSTFVAPIASEWCRDYQNSHPGVQISYRAVGLGEGIRQAIEGTVDFGATDGPMTKVEMESYEAQQHTEVIHFPAVIGAVVPAYNLSGTRVTLNFTPDALAGIFLELSRSGTIQN
jgi:phosphate transport system substrate-binding protein